MQEKIKLMLEQFFVLQDLYFQYLNLIENKIKLLLQENNINFQALQCRVKSFDSLKEKLNNSGIYKSIKEDVKNVGDIAGVRIIFYERESIDALKQVINSCFEIVEWKHNIKTDDSENKNIKYLAEHYILKLKDERLIKFKGFKFELQLVTLLFHAGNELGHSFFYKNEEKLKKINPIIYDEMQYEYHSAWKDLLSVESKFNIIRKKVKEMMIGNNLINKIISKQYVEDIKSACTYQKFGFIIEDLKSAAPFLNENGIYIIKENKLLEVLLEKLYQLRTLCSAKTNENDILDNFNYVFSETLEFLKIYLYVYIEKIPEIISKLNGIVALDNALSDRYKTFLKTILEKDKYNKIFSIHNAVYEWIGNLNDNEINQYLKEVLVFCEELLNLEISGAELSSPKIVTFRRSILNPSDEFLKKRKKILELLLCLMVKLKPEKEIINVILSSVHNPYNNTSTRIKSILNNETTQIFNFILKNYEKINLFYKFQITSEWYFLLKNSRNNQVKKFKEKAKKDIYLNLYNDVFSWCTRETLDLDVDRKRRRYRLNNYAKKINKIDLNFIVILYEGYINYRYNSVESSYYIDLMYQIGKDHLDLGKKINYRIYKKYNVFCPYLTFGILSNENQKSYSKKIKLKTKENKEIQKSILECIYINKYDDNYNIFKYIINLDSIDIEIKSLIAKIILKDKLQDKIYINILFNIIKEANEINHYINFSIIPKMEEPIKDILNENIIAELLYNLNLSDYINSMNSYILKIVFEKEPDIIRKFFEIRLLSNNNLKHRDDYYYIKRAKNLNDEFNNNLNWIIKLINKNKFNIYPISEVSKLLLGKYNKKIEQLLLKKINKKKISINQCITIIWLLKMFDDWFNVSIVAKEIIRKYGDNEEVKNEIECLLFNTGVVSGEYGLADSFKEKANLMKEWEKDKNKKVKEFARENNKMFESYSKKEIEEVILRNREEEEEFKIHNQ